MTTAGFKQSQLIGYYEHINSINFKNIQHFLEFLPFEKLAVYLKSMAANAKKRSRHLQMTD